MSDQSEHSQQWRRELDIFFNGWVFLTRLPAPRWILFHDANLRRSARYFPLIGAIIGALAAAAFYLLNSVLPLALSLLFSMVFSVWLTGGFHEDGLADTCDAFGGGADKPQIFAIMKDSRLGTFGALALFFILAAKFLALLIQAHDPRFWLILIAGHSVSRFAAVTFLRTQTYVQDPETSKSKPLATQIGLRGLVFSAVLGLVPAVLLALTGGLPQVVLALGGVALARWWLARYFFRRIGGFTGDCLGAVQQVTEVIFYSLLLAVL